MSELSSIKGWGESANECAKLLDCLSWGRGLHAPRAWLNQDGSVHVHRTHRNAGTFSAGSVRMVHANCLVRTVKEGTQRRIVITPEGRKALEEYNRGQK